MRAIQDQLTKLSGETTSSAQFSTIHWFNQEGTLVIDSQYPPERISQFVLLREGRREHGKKRQN